MLLCKHYKDDS